jgi:hypothetical protein
MEDLTRRSSHKAGHRPVYRDGQRIESPWRQAVPVNDLEQILSQRRSPGRHSILGDADPQFLTYVRRHLDQIGDSSAVPEYKLIEGDDWSEHPVFA